MNFFRKIGVVAIIVFYSHNTFGQTMTSAYYEYDAECLGVELDGSQTLRIWGVGRNKKDAVEQAKKNAVRVVLFKGIHSGLSGCNTNPVVFEVNAEEKYEDYFNVFFMDGGEYLKYVSMKDERRINLFKKDKEKEKSQHFVKYGITVRVLRSELKKRLTDDIGEAGGRLHTGRSRNDQCAVDLHMYVRKAVVEMGELIVDMQKALIETAEKYSDVIMPGYTHLQRAQPVLFGHHMMAYFSMLERDFDRLLLVFKHADIMPLGAGALAGSTYGIDQTYTQKLLGFSRIYENSMDAVSDRDYVVEFLSFASLVMMHLSRLSEELILWSSNEFNFIELDDAHCTGSSIMPQKKNPDVCELVRGKTGRTYGHLLGLLTTLKGLPLTYNKDMQEDKEGIFDAIDTVHFALSINAAMIRGMKVNGAHMKAVLDDDFSNATDMADYLAK